MSHDISQFLVNMLVMQHSPEKLNGQPFLLNVVWTYINCTPLWYQKYKTFQDEFIIPVKDGPLWFKESNAYGAREQHPRKTLSVQCTLEDTVANEDINDHWSRDFLDTEESMAEMHKR